MNAIFSIDGLPELNARLDKIAVIVANPITREALAAGGKVIKDRAEQLVHRLTGMLASDVVVVTRMRADSTTSGPGQKYVLIGPGWDPDLYRRVARNRGASGREVAPDQTTNPGVYGYFLEVGHRAPGQGLAHDLKYKRDASALRKQGRKLNTYTTPSSRDYGHLSTPPYPWLKPAFDDGKDDAVEAMAEVIETRLGALGLL
jgi:HK97 gp10 family phage protein